MISDAKNQLQSPEEFREGAAGFFAKTVADIYDVYQKRLLQMNAMDFDDLLMSTVCVLERFPARLEHYRRAFRYILIDEYQDTNHAQYLLANAAGRGARQHLRRRRRRPEHLLLARGRHPQHPGVRARLPERQGHPPGAELPQHAAHPGRRQRGREAQPAAQGQESVDRPGRGRHGAAGRGQRRAGRGAVHRQRGAAAAGGPCAGAGAR